MIYIDKNLLAKNSPTEFLKLAWAISPARVKGILKLQMDDFQSIDFDNMTIMSFPTIVKSPKFNINTFMSAFKSDSNEFIRAFRNKRFGVR